MSSLATEMPLAIKRARAVLDQMLEIRGTRGVMVEPQIAIINAEIDEAVAALASGDVIAMLMAYQAIKDYQP